MTKTKVENRGLRQSEPRLGDCILGGESRLSRNILQSNRDFTPYLPKVEFQYKPGFESMACVTFSGLNHLETTAKRKYNIDFNKSDRFSAKMSGTGRDGNALVNVAESFRNDGLIDENLLPFTDDINTWDEFYAPIPENLKKIGKEFLKQYEIQYEWVLPSASNFWESLQYAPIQVTVNTGAKRVDGIYQKVDSNVVNHAVLLYKGDFEKCWYIFDHYDNTFKKYAWDFNFGASMRFDIIKKNMKLVKSNSSTNKTVYLIDAKGIRRAFYDVQHFNAVAPYLGLAALPTGGNADWSQVETINEDELNKFPLGRPLFVIA